SNSVLENDHAPTLHWKRLKMGFHSRWDSNVSIFQQQIPAVVSCLNAVVEAAKRIFRRGPNLGMNWSALGQAVPAFAIMAVMSFFVGLLTGGRQPLAIVPINSVAQAAAEPAPQNVGGQTASVVPHSKKSAVSFQTSHLQITDRETATVIAELS